LAASPSRYLDLFVQETTEQLEAYSLEVGKLERGGRGAADLDEILRLAHSIKGSAGAMGYGAITELAHHLEAFLELLADDSARISKDAIDLLHRSGALLGEMVAVAAGGAQPAAAAEQVVALARAAAPGDEDRRAPESGEVAPLSTPPGDLLPQGRNATTRIRTDALDDLLDEAGDLVLAVARLREEGRSASADGLERSLGSLQRQAKRLHAKVLTARLTPVAAVAERLHSLVRTVGASLGKEVSLELRGAELELDRSVLDGLVDPLGHLLRNCIHHGIEAAAERIAAGKPAVGRLRLEALREKDRMRIVVEDDGRGMDPSRLRRRAEELGLVSAERLAALTDQQALLLCCLPGFSTATEVTEVAGRGVGMDQVARSVERLGGTLEIASTQGLGTRFSLELPFGISVIQVLLVGVADQIHALPLSRVVAAGIGPEGRGGLPLRLLSDLLDPGSTTPALASGPSPRPFVIVEVDDERIAVEVDRLVGYEEAVIKPLSPPLDRIFGVSGSLLLGTGRPVFLLDLPRLLSSQRAVSGGETDLDPRKADR